MVLLLVVMSGSILGLPGGPIRAGSHHIAAGPAGFKQNLAETRKSLEGPMGGELFARLAQQASAAAGRPWAFLLAVGVVLLWGLTGPLFHYSDTWQLVINTGTTIITFLMVFLIQATQNRDGLAIQTKLDGLVKASEASNELLRLEQRDEAAIQRARDAI